MEKMNFQKLTKIPSQELRAQILKIWQENTEAGAALGAKPGDPQSHYAELCAAHEEAMRNGKGILVVMSDPKRADELVGFAWWIIGIPEGKPAHIATIKRMQIKPSRHGEKLGRLLLDYLHSPEVIGMLPQEVEFLHLQFRAGEGLGNLYAQYGYQLNVRWDLIQRKEHGEYYGWLEMIRTRNGAALPEISW
ncbi:GNAT family N-acetyltransferase [Arcanobacterium hippocoleae]|uniref:GNAT superfamily N-acetyltransferase n=1 Tax=Arcanobacterium hippocoleae TaxID=149017 RepID=A0ABU1T3F0_9ACTO|nr:hypothetical protein [Arcanobacterium hippocoleae]MDR6939925.1 GNAT superfamily N-acetyltransferase [Arcanobacterium hippocoleae]